MKNKLFKITISPAVATKNELKHLSSAIDSNELSQFGRAALDFTKMVKQATKSKYILLTSSGSASITLALASLNIVAGDYVICSTSSYIASAAPILHLGAVPVFIDSEDETWNMDPYHLEIALHELQKKSIKPKAIIGVHSYGMPLKLKELLELARSYKIPFIEDAAAALGSSYFKSPVGSLGNFGILSFNGNKIITTSGGGALITNSKLSFDVCQKLASQARENRYYYEHHRIGYNFLMGNINAAIGLGQIEMLKDRVKIKRRIYDKYVKELDQLNGLKFQYEPFGFYSNRWLSCLEFSNNKRREKVRKSLQSSGIESRPAWKPMHNQKAFKKYQYFGSNISELLFSKGLCLPSGVDLSETQQDEIIDIIQKAISNS